MEKRKYSMFRLVNCFLLSYMPLGILSRELEERINKDGKFLLLCQHITSTSSMKIDAIKLIRSWSRVTEYEEAIYNNPYSKIDEWLKLQLKEMQGSLYSLPLKEAKDFVEFLSANQHLFIELDYKI